VDADSKPYLQGYIEWLDDRPETEPDSAFIREISDVFLDMLRLNEKVQKKDRQFELEGGLSPEELSFLIAEYLNHDVSLQQLLLEMTSTRERLEKEQQTIGQIAQRLAAMSQIEAAFERSE
jgi:Lon protease-like protein